MHQHRRSAGCGGVVGMVIGDAEVEYRHAFRVFGALRLGQHLHPAVGTGDAVADLQLSGMGERAGRGVPEGMLVGGVQCLRLMGSARGVLEGQVPPVTTRAAVRFLNRLIRDRLDMLVTRQHAIVRLDLLDRLKVARGQQAAWRLGRGGGCWHEPTARLMQQTRTAGQQAEQPAHRQQGALPTGARWRQNNSSACRQFLDTLLQQQ